MKGTIFVDLDGTLVEHDDLYGSHEQKWLPGAKAKLCHWINNGFIVVITTARADVTSFLAFLRAEQINSMFLKILTNLSTGPRWLINDTPDGTPKAFAINVQRNKGLEDVSV